MFINFLLFSLLFLAININLDSEADIQTSKSMPEVELLSNSSDIQQQQQQPATRKLCCPDCNGGKF